MGAEALAEQLRTKISDRTRPSPSLGALIRFLLLDDEVVETVDPPAGEVELVAQRADLALLACSDRGRGQPIRVGPARGRSRRPGPGRRVRLLFTRVRRTVFLVMS